MADGAGAAVTAAALSSAIDLRGLTLVLPLVALVLLLGWLWARSRKARAQKPGQHLAYTVPGRTAAECRGLLGGPADDDIFEYALETARGGGWYIHFTLHRPTAQPLDTLFLLQFEGDDPAFFSLTFVREAFGMREPVIGEPLLDAFFAQKLGARRRPEATAGG